MTAPPQRVKSPGYVLWAALFAFACDGGGSLTLELHMPDSEELSPVAGDRVAEVTLVTWGDEAPRQSESRALTERGAALTMGNLEPGAELTIAVELRSQTQRLVGYGRTRAPVLARGGEATRVSLEMRRPFAYVAGGGQVDLGGGPRVLSPTLATFDASVDPTGAGSAPSYRGAVPIDWEPTAAATTRDGRELVVVGQVSGAGRLALISTGSHEAIAGSAVSLPSDPLDVAVSAGGRFALVGHGGQTPGVSIVDLDRARAGDPSAPELVPLDAPVGAVRAAPGERPDDPGSAFVLLDRARSLSCSDLPSSTILEIPFSSPKETPVAIDYGAPIHDLAVAPDGVGVVIADGCRGAVVHLSTDGANETLFDLEHASAVAVLDGRVWAAGSRDPTGSSARRPILASVDAGGGSETRFDLPEELALATMDNPSFSGSVQQKLPAEALRVVELAVAPGGGQVALLTEARFHADELIVEDFIPAFPPLDMLTYDYLLVDAASGGVTQRTRTMCQLEEQDPSSYFYSGWQCDTSPDRDALPADEQYIPRNLAMIYGAR